LYTLVQTSHYGVITSFGQGFPKQMCHHFLFSHNAQKRHGDHTDHKQTGQIFPLVVIFKVKSLRQDTTGPLLHACKASYDSL